jgi:hypothetical protein
VNVDAKTMLIRVYEQLLVLHEVAFESLHASNALVQAVAEKEPDLWNLYHKIHLAQVSNSVKQQALLRSQIEQMIAVLKENL